MAETEKVFEGSLKARWRSKYTEDYCEQAYKYLCDSKSLFYLCKEFACSYPTLIAWRKKYPNFGEAVEQGLAVAMCDFNDKQVDNLATRHYSHDGHRWAEYKRFGSKPEATIQIKGLREAIGFNEKFACVEDELERGSLTAKEAALVSKVLIDGTTIDKHAVLVDRIDKLEKVMEDD